MQKLCPIPNEAILVYNKGTAALQNKKYEKAVIHLKKSLQIAETTDAWLNLGTSYKFLDKDAACLEAFKKATSDNIYCMDTCFSVKAMALNNLGLMLYVKGEDKEAEKYYHQALELWPDFYDCKWNLATCVLRQVCTGTHERWAEAWDLYENRFLKASKVCVHHVFSSISDKVWAGQRDCRVVIAQEQGLGDNIMFARFIPQLEKAFNIKCDLQILEPLGALLRENGISCPVEIDVRDYDYMLPLGSICRWVEYIDSATYLKAPEVLIPELRDGLNIGLVWSGSKSHANDRHRSCPVGYFKFLTKYGNLWNLNPGATNVPNWVNKIKLPNWTHTAAVLDKMDFIVTVDTSLAHLAGAMGRPTYMLQPRKETDFRWGVNNTTNLWYDSLKVISNPNDWNLCIENLKKELLK